MSSSLPKRTDVVVIGGGSVGTAVAYHLGAKGVSTVLVEAHSLTAGTTWHTAGMLWRLRPSYVDIELHEMTRQRCMELERDLDLPGSIFKANGGLFVATNEERLKEYQRLCEVGQFYGIDAKMVKPSEIDDVHPLINVDDVVGALYSPGDGTIDPGNVCDAYKRVAKAKQYPVDFLEGIRVTELVLRQGDDQKIAGVLCTEGDSQHMIEADVVVNACGAWAKDVMPMDLPTVPLLAMKHAYVVTEQIPQLTGLGREKLEKLPNVRDHDLSIYAKAQGDALALGGYEVNPEFVTGRSPGKDFAFGLYDLDWDTFAKNLEGHVQRIPCVEEVGVKSTVCGPESFTPDHKPLVGPWGRCEGLYLACGFNSMGMMLAGGVAKELSEWITTGASDLDMFAFDPRRFHPSCVDDPKWVKRTTHESYAKTYAIVFPHDEPLAGRSLRTSAVQLDNCVFQARHGFERPGWFTSSSSSVAPLEYDYYGAYAEDGAAWRLDWSDGDDLESRGEIPAHGEHPYEDLITGDLTFGWGSSFGAVAKECEAARTKAVVFDQSYFGKYLVSGSDAEAFVNYVCAAGAPKKLHRVQYTPLCNEKGGVEADLTVTRLPDSFYFVAGGSTCTRDLAWLRKHSGASDDVQITDVSDERTVLSVQGPLSRQIVASLVEENSEEALGGRNFDPATTKIMPFSSAVTVRMAGVDDVMVLRLTFVGELGFELHVPANGAQRVLEALHAKGAVDAGYRAMDSLSADKGYRHWHADLSNAETPFEANIGFTLQRRLIKNRDASFLGGPALLDLVDRNATLARKRLVCLTLSADGPAYGSTPPSNDPPLHGTETIWRDDVCVGIVRSTAFSHTLRRTIAYGYVHSKHPFTSDELPGSIADDEWLSRGRWAIGDRGTQLPADLHLEAPFDPTNTKVKTVI